MRACECWGGEGWTGHLEGVHAVEHGLGPADAHEVGQEPNQTLHVLRGACALQPACTRRAQPIVDCCPCDRCAQQENTPQRQSAFSDWAGPGGMLC